MAKNGNGHKQLSGASRKLLTSLVADVREATATFRRACVAINDGQNFPQDLMEGALLLEELKSLCGEATKEFEQTAIAHKDAKGQFEHGRVALQVNITTRRNVKWKEVAITLAKENDPDLDEKAYVNEITESVEPTTSKKVKLIESE